MKGQLYTMYSAGRYRNQPSYLSFVNGLSQKFVEGIKVSELSNVAVTETPLRLAWVMEEKSSTAHGS